MLGLLLGFAVAVARERLDRRVRQAADVERDARVPVLAELTGEAAPRFDEVLAPYAAGGRTFNRLRNEVLASLRPQDRVVVVTGASRGAAATLVAANLAAAMARAGAEVVLVGAHQPDSLPGRGAAGPALRGRRDPGPVRRARPARSRWPRPRPAGAARAVAARDHDRRYRRPPAGLLQSQALRDALTLLRRHDAYVVDRGAVDRQSSADAQSLARLADAAILTVELRRTRRPEVADAAAQLTRVGTPLLGTVVLPRLAPVPAADDADIEVDSDWDEDDAGLRRPRDPGPTSRRLATTRPTSPRRPAAAEGPAEQRRARRPQRRRSRRLRPHRHLVLLRGRPVTPHHRGRRRPATSRRAAGASSGPIDNDTAVLRRLDPETLREMDRAAANGRNLNGRNAGDAAGADPPDVLDVAPARSRALGALAPRSALPAWPVAGILLLYPLWWALGLGVLIFPLMAVPMAWYLIRAHATGRAGAAATRLRAVDAVPRRRRDRHRGARLRAGGRRAGAGERAAPGRRLPARRSTSR